MRHIEKPMSRPFGKTKPKACLCSTKAMVLFSKPAEEAQQTRELTKREVATGGNLSFVYYLTLAVYGFGVSVQVS